MTEITKVSQITPEDLATYIRLGELSEDDVNTLKTIKNVVTAFIKAYTGQSEEGMDDCPDFVAVVFIMSQDLWDNRTLYVDTQNLNFAVKSILDLHSVNLL